MSGEDFASVMGFPKAAPAEEDAEKICRPGRAAYFRQTARQEAIRRPAPCQDSWAM